MSKQDKTAVYNIIAFIFADRGTAQTVSSELKNTAKDVGDNIVANAVVEVDEKGKAHIHEAGHGGRGTAAGLVVGGLLGLIGGPAGLLAWAVAGGVIGGFAGKIGGRAIPKKDLEELSAQMKPSTSAILAIVEDKQCESLIDDMKGYKAKVVTLTVGDEVSGELAQAVAVDVEVPASDTTAPAAATGAAAPAPAVSEAKKTA
jgi:uncharacterized membrane protein